MPLPDTTFTSLRQVHAHLADQGYKLAYSTLCKHQAERGWIHTNAEGVYGEKEIESYLRAARLVQHGAPATKTDALAERKQRAEVKKLESQAEYQHLKAAQLAGSLVDSSEYEQALTRRAALFRRDCLNLAHAIAPGVVAVAGGDKRKVPDVTEYLKDKFLDMLNRYADEDLEVEAAEEDAA